MGLKFSSTDDVIMSSHGSKQSFAALIVDSPRIRLADTSFPRATRRVVGFPSLVIYGV